MTGLKSAQIAKSIGKQFHFHNKEVRGNISLDLVSFKCIPTYILTGVGATDALLEKEGIGFIINCTSESAMPMKCDQYPGKQSI